VIINDLNVVRIAVLPPEADAPLIVDANTVLTGAIAFELFEAVPGRNAEVIELFGGVHDAELPQHEPLELGREATDWLALEQALGVPVGEAVDHGE